MGFFTEMFARPRPREQVRYRASLALLNAMSNADRADIDATKAIALMQAQPSMIKRPVLEVDGQLLVGFKPQAYQVTLG